MSNRKSILYLTNRLPYPPNKGDRIRTFHQIDHLAFSHDVYCACFVDQRSTSRHVSALKRWCKDVIAVPWTRSSGLLHAAVGGLTGRPCTEAAFSSGEMRRRLQRWYEHIRFDVVVAFSSMMSPYALQAPAGRRVIDLCDVDSEKWRDYAKNATAPLSWLFDREARRLQRREQECVEKFDAAVLITERERRALGPAADSTHVHVVSNGVRLPTHASLRPSRCAPVIGFIGSMDYKPNADGVRRFARKIWPLVLNQIPEARFHIIGRNPTAAVRRLARLPGVIVTGEVKEPRLMITRCRVMVAPLQISRGIPNKVLESMAAGRPVVATSAVAETLSATPARDLVVAGDDARFAAEVIDLCRNDERCDAIGHAGYRYVASAHSWGEEMRKFEELVVGESPAGRQKMPTDKPGVRTAPSLGIALVFSTDPARKQIPAGNSRETRSQL